MIGRSGRSVGAPPWLALVLVVGVGATTALGLSPPVRGVGTSTGSGCTPGSGLALNATPSAGAAPLAVQFTLTDPHGPASWVNWTFGDGSPAADGRGDALLSTSHRYPTWGLFEAVVNITQGNASLLCAAAVNVDPPAFTVGVRADPATGRAPLTVTFTVNASGGTGRYLTAGWTFGDGSTATGFNVTYTYLDAGNYTATLSALDSANQSAESSAPIEVDPGVVQPVGSRGAGGEVPAWEAEGIGGAAIVLAVALVLLWRWNTAPSERRRADDPEVTAPPVGRGGASEPPAPEIIAAGSVEPVPPRATPATDDTGDSLAVGTVDPEVLPVDTRSSAPALPAPEEGSSEKRLKVSQRVMLHLYLQGHLADGEVAPIGFTQGGMAEKLGVAQSPLSSVLRRLVVAGLVAQDTRHVRGQPRRLRVYRLTPVGEVVARDLYRNHRADGERPSDQR